MRIPFIVATFLGIALTLIPSAAPASEAPIKEKVDLLLVLAADVSGSIDPEKFQLQRRGYADALVDPRVLRAIRSGPYGRIAVAYVEWSGLNEQKVVVNWTIIDGLHAAQRFSEQLGEIPRPYYGATAIGAAIEFSVRLLHKAPYSSERMTIDISGDGTSNDGRDERMARDDAIREGIVINGMPILTMFSLPEHLKHTNPPGGLEAYYRVNVRGGPGSFVVVARDYQSFAAAVVKKMIAEIAMR